jgi:hypothetical protein
MTIKALNDIFENGGLTAVERYLETLNNGIVSSTSNALTPTDDMFQLSTEQSTTNFLLDKGRGYISQGINSLSLISKIIEGVNPNSLFLFGDSIVFGDPKTLRQLNDEQLFNFVLRNLRISDYFTIATSRNAAFCESYKQFLISIGKRVRTGSFIKEEFQERIFSDSKRIIKLAIAQSGVRSV